MLHSQSGFWHGHSCKCPHMVHRFALSLFFDNSVNRIPYQIADFGDVSEEDALTYSSVMDGRWRTRKFPKIPCLVSLRKSVTTSCPNVLPIPPQISPKRPLDICHLGSTLTLVRTQHGDDLDHHHQHSTRCPSALCGQAAISYNRSLSDQVRRNHLLVRIPKSIGRDIELRTSCLSRLSLWHFEGHIRISLLMILSEIACL